MRFATKAIHAGQGADPRTGAVNTPIYLSTTFKQDGIGNMREGYEYSRTGNPTRDSLEATLAALEGADHGLCFASGSAASAAVFDMLKPGDGVVSTIDVYGGTYRMCRQVYSKYGIDFRFLEVRDAGALLAEVRDDTKMIWLETPTNPLLTIHDIARIAREKPPETLLIVDNTFATPALQQPLSLGADAVVHSVTKYLGGHSDVVGGAIVTSRDDIHDACRFYQNAVGGVPSPFDCYLVQRGIKTLEIRMERQSASAGRVAEYLAGHPRVERVYFPGLPDHPGHDVAARQMKNWSGMVSFVLKGSRDDVQRASDRFEIFAVAESLGAVESLCCYPYSMTHGAIPPHDKDRIGISENLLRLSIGLEDVEDLIEDLDRALS